jgi:peptide/nickel transport system permease protein
MRAYIIRRLLLMIPTFLLVTIVVFLSLRLIPGDVIDLMQAQIGGAPGRDLDRAALESLLGLDKPIYVQYGEWLGNAFLHGDLGTSLYGNQSVIEEIFRRFPISLELATLSIIISLLIAIPIGTFSAVRQDTMGDYIARSFAIALVAIPGFWVGTMVMIYPTIWWGWSPPMQVVSFTESPLRNLGMFIIPAIIMGMHLSGTTMRMTRTMMLEVLRQDYIRTAWAKGLRERVIVTRHALRNSLIPVITIIGTHIPLLIGGTVIIEQIFNLPGIGRLVLESLNRRDYPMVSGVNLFIASMVLVVNLVVDLAYAYLDPRIRYR